jgi:hypothetical protein
LSPSVSPSLSASPSPSPGYQGYTRGDYADLPADDTDLETAYTEGDITTVATNDEERVTQSASGQYAIHQYKEYAGAETKCIIEWEGQSSTAPSAATIYLQVYNRSGTPEWETLDSNNTESADTDFSLTGDIADLTNYKDGNTVVSFRVYQFIA